MALAVLPDLAAIERSVGSFYDYSYDAEFDGMESKGFEELTLAPAALKTLIPTLHELGGCVRQGRGGNSFVD